MVTASQERESGLWVPGYWETEAERDRPPSLDEIMSLYTEGRLYFKGFHDQCRLEEDYYGGKRSVPAPEGIDSIWPATANAIVNIATDHVDVNNLAIDVPAAPRARARAERLKKFYQGAWLSIKKPVLRTSVAQAFMYGIAFRKVMFNPLMWPKAPLLDSFGDDLPAYKEALQKFMDLRRITWPIDMSVVKPTNLIWDDSRAKMKWCIEFYERPVKDLQRRYPEWVPSAESQSTGMTQYIMYWDEEWCAYIADKQFIFGEDGPVKHGYGFLNYTPVIPARSYTFEDGLPQDRFKGILNPVHSLLDEEARLLTQINAIIRTVAYRTLDFFGPPLQAEKAAGDYQLFGGKNVIPTGVEVQASPMIQVPPDLMASLTTTQNYIEQATFPNVIRGMRPRGVSSGFGVSVLAGMGRLVFQGTADGIARSIEQDNSHFAQLVENVLKGPITVHARTDLHNFDQRIEPDDIRGLLENTVRIKAEAPEEREREALLAMRLHGAGIISLYEAMRRSGVGNPLEEQVQIRAEQLLNSEEFIMSQVQQLLQRIGLPSQLAQSVSPSLGGSSGNVGSQNLGGPQLQRPGEGNIQQARVASQQGQPSVFPQGQGGISNLGALLGNPTGGPLNLPSGQRIGG
jgi:hypothetical protein